MPTLIKVSKVFLAVLLAVTPSTYIYAETVSIIPASTTTTTSTTTTATTTPTAATSGNGGTSPVSGSLGSMSGGSNINQNAGQAKDSQTAGMLSNLASAGMMAAMGATMISNPSTQTAGYIMLAMAALAAAQGMMLGQNAGDSGKTQDASQYGGPSWSNPDYTSGLPTDGGTGGTGGTGTGGTGSGGNNGGGTGGGGAQTIPALASQTPAGAQAIKALTDAGYTLSKDGLTDPSGKTIPTSAFSSPSAMTAAGLNSSTVSAVKTALDRANAEGGKVVAMGLNTEAGGGGGAGMAGGAGDRDPASDNEAWDKAMNAFKFKNPFNKSDADKKNMVAGKSIRLAGEPIGVAAENIFQKINRHYDIKKKQKEFIE